MSISKKLVAGVAASAVPVLLSANPAGAIDVEDTVTTEFTTTIDGQAHTCEVEAHSRITWSSPNDPEHPAPQSSTDLITRTTVIPSATCDVDVVLDSVAAGATYKPEGSDRTYQLYSDAPGNSVYGSLSLPGVQTDIEFFHYVRYFNDDFGSSVPASLEVITDPNPK